MLVDRTEKENNMSTRTEEVEKSERDIRNAEIRQKTLQIQIDTLDRELANLHWTQTTLQENLNNLRKEKIIALATEYKKIKSDLAKTKARLIIVNNEKIKIDFAYQNILKFLKEAQEKHANLLYTLDNNILYGKFGRQTDG